MNSYPAPLPTKRTAGQQERVVVKWTVYVAVRDENICQFDKVRLLVNLSNSSKCRKSAWWVVTAPQNDWK